MKSWRSHMISSGRRALLAGASISAFAASGAVDRAQAADSASLLSPAALTQAATQRTSGTQSAMASSSALLNAQAQAQAALSAANLAQAAQTLKTVMAAQSAASASSQLTLDGEKLIGSAWNGKTLSGLKTADQSNQALWTNAGKLQIDTATKTATVTQTASKALLTWTSLDLNKGETLVFDQQGHADWTVLNRVVAGPTGSAIPSPSYILGQIKADGTVYIINPNGIIFGPASQVNVHSLIASSLDVGDPTMTLAQRDSFYLNQGILSAGVDQASFSYSTSDTRVEGDVTVMAGASITASLAPRSVSPDAGGFVYLIAPNVTNAGTISTPAGETMLVSAQLVQLTANQYNDGGIDTSTATFRAVGPNFNLDSNNPAAITPWRQDGVIAAEIRKPGEVLNTGLIEAERGVIILNGDEVTLNGGVIGAATSITRNSEIFIDARLQLTVTGGASIQVLPDENGETIPQSTIDGSSAASPSFVAGSVDLRGNTVDIASGSLIEAPGGTVSVTGVTFQTVSDEFAGDAPSPEASAVANSQARQNARIYMAANSTIDVSGLDDVTLPISDNLVSFKPFGNEFADQPLQRNGLLRGVELTVDIRQTGTNADGTSWVGTPLADVSALASNISRSIDYLLTTGGKVTLSSQQADEVILRKGSTIDVAGGYVYYSGGTVNTSNLLTADGRVVNIANANPLDTYVGVAGVATATHPRWGSSTTETYVNPLLGGAHYENGYLEGHDAGGIILNNGNPSSVYALDGAFYAGAIVGQRQAAGGIRPVSATANTIQADPTAMPSSGYLQIFGETDVVIAQTIAALPTGFTIKTALPTNYADTTGLSASALTTAGFGSISASFSGKLDVAADARLSVADGGSIALQAGSADVDGSLTARSGSISIETKSSLADGANVVVTNPTPAGTFDLVIGSRAVLDTSGRWVNDTGATADTVVGGAYINGGAITLKTDSADASCTTLACTSLAGLGTTARVDTTGNIVIDKGALLDLSSGGRIAANGQFQLDSAGRAAGKGGSLTLATYVHGFNALNGPIPTTSIPAATIQFQGSDGSAAENAAAFDDAVGAYGFAQGGTLSVTAPGIRIGGSGAAPKGTFALTASFFDGNAFSGYSLNSIATGTVVTAGSTVIVNQRNLVANPTLIGLATGSKVEDATGIGYLPVFIRGAANLSLGATLAPLPKAPYNPPSSTAPLSPHVALMIGAGASIETDPGATVQIAVTGRDPEDAPANSSVGNIGQQTGVAEILGTIRAPAGTIAVTGGLDSEVWLGASSRLDVAGTVLIDQRQTQYVAGSVLAGGTVALTTASGGTVIGLKGATIDVSGTVGTLDIRQDGSSAEPGPHYVATKVWSNAGAIDISASTMLYDGSFSAHGGTASANGGSLTIGLPATGTVTVVENSAGLPPAPTPTGSTAAIAGEAVFQADSLKGSGVATLTLSAGPTTGSFTPGTVDFNGNVTIAGLPSLTVDASVIALSDVRKPVGGCNVCLSATYVALNGAGVGNAVAGKGILRVSAAQIDIFDDLSGNGPLTLSGVADAQFVSSGDIRLGVPTSNVLTTGPAGELPAGELVTAGNLTLDAAQIYPESDVDFTLKSSAANGRITFRDSSKALEAPPLSAGGQISVDAAFIDQGGRLLAPLGVIRLGAKSAADLSPNDNTGIFVATKTVTLDAGSVTSVSLAGQLVPFGETTDNKNWSYDSQLSLPLANAPAKQIAIAGNTVDMAKGSTVDLSGGGDIQALEFVKGTGGSRDVLAESNVYAIIPGYNPVSAPIDLDFAKVLGDTQPLAGSSIYLSGYGGLKAGYYTLLPAHYATLPGSYRVTVVSGSQDALVSQNRTLADGTLQIAGYVANSDAGTRSARSEQFDIQSSAVWRQYSEIDQASGNTYFKALAADSTTVTTASRLPIDAGHLIVDARTTLDLQATFDAAAGTGGRGSEVDIAGTDLQVVAPDGKVMSGYVGLDATQLTGLGADSLLIGGVRSDNSDGTEAVQVTADSVVVSNGAQSALSGPQIILVSGVPRGKSDSDARHGLQIEGGSVIDNSGTLASNDPTTFILGADYHFTKGEGAFLAVSSGSALTVTRSGASYTGGDLTIQSGVAFKGGSLTLDATGKISIAGGSRFALGDIAISSGSLGFGDVPNGTSGTVLDAATLAALTKADSLSFRSVLGAMTFYGDTTIAMNTAGSLSFDAAKLAWAAGGTGSKVTLSAGTVTFTNSGAAATSKAIAGKGTLAVSASDIEIDAGTQQLSGFSSVALAGQGKTAGTGVIAVRGAGSLDAGAATLTIDTPHFLVGGGASQTIRTTGNVTFQTTGGAGALSASPEIGGTLTVDGGAVSVDTLIQATSGGVTLEAATGAVSLGANAQILANGYAQAFFDVTKVTGGGSVSLIADAGNIVAQTGARIDVSSPAGYTGYAGSITLSAENGTVTLGKSGTFDTSIIGGSVAGDSGGSLEIDTSSIGVNAISVPTLFSDTVDIHIRQGNFGLASSLTAATVTLTVDTGTLTIGQTIDASGASGGTISLFGGQGVTLTSSGKLLATASDATKHGGDVVIGTEVAADNGSAADGIIDLAGGTIDVSNTAAAANGGTVRLRAPLTATGNDVAIDAVQTTIAGASSVTIEAFKVFSTTNSAFTGVIDPVAQPGFYGSCTAQGVCSGTLLEFVENFALSAASQGKFAGISGGILHLQPGIELVNNDPAINNGDITVASNWNLGAGMATGLVNGTDANGNPELEYVAGISQIEKLFYRTDQGSPTGEAGTLTLRAERDVNIDASITDGFFQTQNRLDPTYLQSMNTWVSTAIGAGASTDAIDVGGYILAGPTAGNSVTGAGPLPVAPYVAAANGISPVRTADDPTPIAGADLFPLIKDANGTIAGAGGNYTAIASWSYRITGGADVNSANPLAVRALSVFADGTGKPLSGHGNVVIDGGGAITDSNINSDGSTTTLEIPTIVRTGTGSIDIAAARDFTLANPEAPGVVYTAGRNSVDLQDPGYVMKSVADPLNPGQTIEIATATNPAGFLEPQVLTCDGSYGFGCNAYGPITAAAYPVDGGRLTVTAQQDIVGVENMTLRNKGQIANYQYYAAWLLAQGNKLSNTQYGVFSTLSGYVANGSTPYTPAQTSWWINFGSFDQGLMSVGGNVRVVAGRDITQLSISLPTTERTSGGLSATITAGGKTIANIPVTTIEPSGDLTVIAGGNINSGAFYEGSGKATIKIGGAVQADWSAHTDPTDTTSPLIPVSTVLAVDTGTITLTARGSIDIAGVVSPVSLQNVSDPSGATDSTTVSSYLSSYGPASAVTVQSASGNIVANSLTNGTVLLYNNGYVNDLLNGVANTSGFAGTSAYPANFSAIAIDGSITVANALRLASSDTGTITLLAEGALNTSSQTDYLDSGSAGPTTVAGFQALSTGASLVERQFDPTAPLSGFAPPAGSQTLDLGPKLLHQGDGNPDLFYAVTGDIVSGEGQSVPSATSPQVYALSWEITKPAVVHAGQDIVDLPFFGQNLAATDVTQIVAGRDIFYTGNLPLEQLAYPGRPDLSQPENSAGLSLAGPGFFVVEAGRNLGPFVTASADVAAAENQSYVTDPNGTGIITFGNNVTVGNRLIVDGYKASANNQAVDDPFATGQNSLLPRQGADIVALFGVGKGVNDQAVIRDYVDPATQISSTSYGPALVTFLQTLGLPAHSEADAWKTFQTLSTSLQQVFADQVFFNELQLAGTTNDYIRGYRAIQDLFPDGQTVPPQLPVEPAGYTFNGYSFDGKNTQKAIYAANGKLDVVQVPTGNLEMLHATIKTLQSASITVQNTDGTKSTIAVGGDIYLLGPGGNIDVGSQAIELNNYLTDSALGILTLDNGVIDTMTDGNVLVNESRILTVQGGDILLWSSNGNLDAGRGAKTTVDFRPLSVNFDPDDLQTINLNGLVSGAGIGTIQSTPDAPVASAVLVAPRGIINAGDAGVRSSGNIFLAALKVLNAANLSFGGTVTNTAAGPGVNLGALESASSTAAGSTNSAMDAAAAASRGAQTAPQALPSLITVEVLGFGDCDPEGGKACPQ